MMFVIYLLSFVLAACALVYELVLAQTVAVFTANQLVWVSLAVGVFVGSMGAGAWSGGRFFKNAPLELRLFRVEIVLSLVGGGSVLLLHAAQSGALSFLSGDQVIAADVLFFFSALVLSSAVGFLAGIELPLLLDMAVEAVPGRNLLVRVLGMDYLGSLSAGLIFPLFLLPRFGLLQIAGLIAVVNLMAAVVLWWVKPVRGAGQLLWSALAAILIFLTLAGAGRFEQYFLRRFYALPDESAFLAQVQRVRSPYQSIDLVSIRSAAGYPDDLLDIYSNGKAGRKVRPHGLALYLGHDFQFLSDVEKFYHEFFAHVPMAISVRVPESVLVLGGGDGLLIRELLKYSSVRKIILVEIDRKVVDLFRSASGPGSLTQGAFEDPRVQVVIDDAFYYVRQSREFFDAIYLDFPAPSDYNLSRLYSREFYAMARARLSAEGFLVMDVPGLEQIPRQEEPGKDTRTWDILYNTLFAAGFGDIRPFFSALEDDNPRALALFRKLYTGVDIITRTDTNMLTGQTSSMQIRGGEAVAREMLRDFLQNLSSGFILARAQGAGTPDMFYGQGVTPDIVNSSRVRAALLAGNQLIARKNSRLVNSIFRPLLPDFSEWWRLKTPY
jgi:spermidine synthase